ncbi:MAG: alpha/beta fold hydrolase [Candidatus Binataceae bacterium]
MIESRFVAVNGIKLHYLDYGGAGKQHLVCIHGLTGNAHNFDGLAPHLIEKYHAMSLDVRGRGDSQWGPQTEYIPQQYLSDLAALLDALDISRVTLVGTSMGGMIATLYGGGYPDRVDRVVLNDIGPDIDPAGIARISSYVGEAPESFKDLNEVAEYYRKTYPPAAKLAPEQLIEFVKWAVKPGGDGRLVWKMDPAIRRPMRGPSARPFDLWIHYARFKAPVLVVRGADSDVLSRRTCEKMQHSHPQTTVVEVPGVGHAPSLLEPESLAALSKFLRL